MINRHHSRAGELHGEIRGLDKSKVDTKGYMNIQTQVKRMEAAGIRLEDYRRMNFQDSMSLDEEWIEPSPLDSPDCIPSVDVPAAEAELKRRLDSKKINADVETQPEAAEVKKTDADKLESIT